MSEGKREIEERDLELNWANWTAGWNERLNGWGNIEMKLWACEQLNENCRRNEGARRISWHGRMKWRCWGTKHLNEMSTSSQLIRHTNITCRACEANNIRMERIFAELAKRIMSGMSKRINNSSEIPGGWRRRWGTNLQSQNPGMSLRGLWVHATTIQKSKMGWALAKAKREAQC